MEDHGMYRLTRANGAPLFEGDIEVDAEFSAEKSFPSHRVWPLGIIYYTIDPSLRERRDQERKVNDAFNHWRQKTNLWFVKRTDEPDYVTLTRGNGCTSKLGRQGGQQLIRLGTSCQVPAIVHEIGHTVGLKHEHNRPDRDDFIEVHWDQIQPDAVHNFQKGGGAVVGEIDFRSIMIYRPGAFAIGSLPTMSRRDSGPWGATTVLSAGDATTVATIYQEELALRDDAIDPPSPIPTTTPAPITTPPPPPPTELRFHDGRFVARLDWVTPDGAGRGRAVAGGSQVSGNFYFFDPTNWELLVKVLDGRGINDHWWAYASGATDLQWDLTITDTQTGRDWSAHNDAGVRAPAFTDTKAWPRAPA